MKEMNIVYKNISDVIPYENNPRHNEAAVDYVANSIKEFGFKVPIIIDKDNIVVTGHTRLKASEKLGLTEVPCIYADDLTDNQIKAYRIADNKVSEFSSWDLDKLDLELGDINLDMTEFGFEDLNINIEEFGTEFELPDGDKSSICQMTFTLHEKQKELIEYAMQQVKNDINETFGNTNSNGNALYEVIRQWAEQKK